MTQSKAASQSAVTTSNLSAGISYLGQGCVIKHHKPLFSCRLKAF